MMFTLLKLLIVDLFDAAPYGVLHFIVFCVFHNISFCLNDQLEFLYLGKTDLCLKNENHITYSLYERAHDTVLRKEHNDVQNHFRHKKYPVCDDLSLFRHWRLILINICNVQEAENIVLSKKALSTGSIKGKGMCNILKDSIQF